MGSAASKKKNRSLVAISAVNAFNQAGERHNKNNGTIEDDRNTKVEDMTNAPSTCTNDETNQPSVDNGTFSPAPLERKPSEKDAAVMIQRVYRGHQERRQRKKENEMAIVIQRRYRRHISTSSEDQKETSEVDTKKALDERRGKRKDRGRAWRDKKTETKKVHEAQVSEQVQQELHSFQDEIIMLKWQADQQIEKNFMIDTVPARVILISSKIGKPDLLAEAVHDKPNMITILYDFEKDTFKEIADEIKSKLNEYKEGCRAQSVCLYCQGGPGFLYVVKRKVLTAVKLKKHAEEDQRQFWISIGEMMSKVTPDDTLVHVMGSNILGNETGQELFDDVSTLMKPNIAYLKSPLELSAEGKAMVDLYFDHEKYKDWKLQRYTKTEHSLISKYKES